MFELCYVKLIALGDPIYREPPLLSEHLSAGFTQPGCGHFANEVPLYLVLWSTKCYHETYETKKLMKPLNH